MQIEVSDAGDNLRKVMLIPRLDTASVLGIETKFVTALVPGGKSAIVDLSQVDFIASMGIRMFISVARIMRDKHAKLVFYAPQQMVDQVLESASFRKIVPVCADATEAVTVVQG